MPDQAVQPPRLRSHIGPVPASTTPIAEGASPRVRSLPHDLLEEASNRLAVIALVCALLWAVGTILYRAVLANMGHSFHLQTPDLVSAGNSLLSLGLYFYTRRASRHPRFLLNLGLGYMVLTAFFLGVVLHWDKVPHETLVMPQISWIGALVLIFAALIPNSPGKVLVAGLLAVSMNPLGMLLAKYRGSWDFGPLSNALVMHYPDYLLVGVAVVIANAVTKLGEHVSKAREMGSYRLVERLGMGGMGEVWRARHNMLARDAAIKLIQPEMMTRGSASDALLVRRRFEQEANATALLSSPHTVALYDFGVTPDGVFYYVMELLEGIDLDTLVKRFGPQSPARVVHILSQVCRSLEDAHRHGMVHRDIKPGNIFLCRMGAEYDFAKVLDFGLVKIAGGDETMSVAGATTGTPAFLAPELAKGDSDIDGRTDLYGLSCVAYWLLTGRYVYEEKSATAMVLAHVQKSPVPPSERSAMDVPESLDRLIMMCLAKDPAARPAGAGPLAKLLAECGGFDRWTREEAEQWWLLNLPVTTAAAASTTSRPDSESVTLSK